MDDHQRIKQRFWIKEQKRGKRQEVEVYSSIQETIEEYLVAYPEFPSDFDHFVNFNTKANTFAESI